MFPKKTNKKIQKNFFLFFLFSFFFFINIFSFAEEKLECKDYGEEELSKEQYDMVLKICEEEIEENSSKLKDIRGESSSVKNVISQLNSQIRISQSYINQKIAKANNLKKNTSLTKSDIEKLTTEQKKVNDSLKSLIFHRNQVEGNTAVEAFLSEKTISEFFEEIDIAFFLEEKISGYIKKIKKEKEDLEKLRLELEERESVERQLAEEKTLEREKIKKNKSYKDELLGVLKKQEGGIVKNIEINEKIKNDILSRQFSVASGEKVSFGEAYNIILPYKRELGMDPAFVLAILFQESGWKGQIGGNIGQCTYNQRNSSGNAKNGYEVMKKSWQKDYLEIMNDLGIDAETQKVSCPIPRDGAYGGAMGPAQFIPPTWKYVRKSAAKIISKEPEELSPFINRDAFIASATLLKWNYYSKSCADYSKKYRHISSDRTLRERCAAAKYYAGSNWFRFRMSYGESVLKRANRFREDIKTLNL